MPSFQGEKEGGAERLFSQGLLAAKGEWALPLGVSQVPPLRGAAQVGLGMMASLALFCLASLLSEAWSGQGGWPKAISAGILSLAWLTMAWRMQRSLRSCGSAMLLRWGGLPPLKAGTALASAGDLPGWSQPETGQSVAVQVVFDLGQWVLIKMLPVDGKAPAIWSWLDARIAFQGPAGHQLRALLFSRRANLVGPSLTQGGVDQATVASSGGLQPSWSNLFSPRQKPAQVAKQTVRHAQAGAQGLAVDDRLFADTLIEPPRGGRE